VFSNLRATDMTNEEKIFALFALIVFIIQETHDESKPYFANFSASAASLFHAFFTSALDIPAIRNQ
jgi:hypothetical protein